MVPDSPIPLNPSGLFGRWRLREVAFERRQLAGGDHRVVGEGRRQGVPGVVVHHFLEERLTDPLGHPAVHLAERQEGIEDRAGVVDRHHPLEAHRSGLDVDGHHRDVGAERERSDPSPAKSASQASGSARRWAAMSTHPTETAGVPAT